MPRPRNPENKGLPLRWKAQHGAYYYQVPKGQESAWDGKKLFRLGGTLPEAHTEWAARLENTTNKINTVGQLLDRYALEVVPKKAAKTRIENIRQIATLRPIFGPARLVDVKPQHIYQYSDRRGAKVSAKREIAVLSHALTMAVQWGLIDKHPFKGEVRLEGEKPRTRYIEDWEVLEALSLSSLRDKGSVKAIQAYIRVKLLTGLRRGDLLRLQEVWIKEDGIHVTTSKTGKPIIYEWTEELRAAVEMARAVRPVHISPFLFCNKKGQGYVDEKTGDPSGWNSMWQRYMDRVLTETKVTERFTEHDLRAKVGSDAESLERARALLAHADSRMTQKAYRRLPERVKPLR